MHLDMQKCIAMVLNLSEEKSMMGVPGAPVTFPTPVVVHLSPTKREVSTVHLHATRSEHLHFALFRMEKEASYPDLFEDQF